MQVLDFVDGDEPMLVMELLRGKSLTALVKENGKLEPARAVALMTQVLSALQAAHDARIVHRDVKPENIFVCESPLPYELVKVLDFGLARPLDESRRIARTVAGLALGTPAYMAPEQARGSAVDVRMDVFAAGVTLYYALSGRRPFEGKTSSELVRAVSKQPPLPLDALCPDLDLDLVRVVERSLSKDPDARFASARAFLEALPSPPNQAAKPVERRSKANDTTAGTRKRAAPAAGRESRIAGIRSEPLRGVGSQASLRLSEITVRSPAVAAGMARLAQFAPDGASALALGPSGLARWTQGGGWSARELPPGVTPADVRGIVCGDLPVAPKARGLSALIFDTAGRVYLRVQGAFSALDVPPRLVIHGAHLEGERVALAGVLGDEGVVVEIGGSIHRIGRGIIMHAVTRARSGALVACGSRGTVCVIDDRESRSVAQRFEAKPLGGLGGGAPHLDRRVHAHVAGRSTLVAIAALEEGFLAVGEGGVIVHASGATVATATETKWVDDDLALVNSTGKLFCAVGRRVHVAAVDGGVVSQPVSMSPGSIRDAWIGVVPSEGGSEVVVRMLTSSAAVVECRVSDVP